MGGGGGAVLIPKSLLMASRMHCVPSNYAGWGPESNPRPSLLITRVSTLATHHPQDKYYSMLSYRIYLHWTERDLLKRKKSAIYYSFIYNFTSDYVKFIECWGQTERKEENVVRFTCAHYGGSAEGTKTRVRKSGSTRIATKAQSGRLSWSQVTAQSYLYGYSFGIVHTTSHWWLFPYKHRK